MMSLFSHTAQICLRLLKAYCVCVWEVLTGPQWVALHKNVNVKQGQMPN